MSPTLVIVSGGSHADRREMRCWCRAVSGAAGGRRSDPTKRDEPAVRQPPTTPGRAMSCELAGEALGLMPSATGHDESRIHSGTSARPPVFADRMAECERVLSGLVDWTAIRERGLIRTPPLQGSRGEAPAAGNQPCRPGVANAFRHLPGGLPIPGCGTHPRDPPPVQSRADSPQLPRACARWNLWATPDSPAAATATGRAAPTPASRSGHG
jgi:hypothetical protein